MFYEDLSEKASQQGGLSTHSSFPMGGLNWHRSGEFGGTLLISPAQRFFSAIAHTCEIHRYLSRGPHLLHIFVSRIFS